MISSKSYYRVMSLTFQILGVNKHKGYVTTLIPVKPSLINFYHLPAFSLSTFLFPSCRFPLLSPFLPTCCLFSKCFPSPVPFLAITYLSSSSPLSPPSSILPPSCLLSVNFLSLLGLLLVPSLPLSGSLHASSMSLSCLFKVSFLSPSCLFLVPFLPP